MNNDERWWRIFSVCAWCHHPSFTLVWLFLNVVKLPKVVRMISTKDSPNLASPPWDWNIGVLEPPRSCPSLILLSQALPRLKKNSICLNFAYLYFPRQYEHHSGRMELVLDMVKSSPIPYELFTGGIEPIGCFGKLIHAPCRLYGARKAF